VKVIASCEFLQKSSMRIKKLSGPKVDSEASKNRTYIVVKLAKKASLPMAIPHKGSLTPIFGLFALILTL
jgi:hypothetical protein